MEPSFKTSIDYLILKDTLELVRRYNTNSQFKRILDRVLPVSSRVIYKGRLLRVYLWTIQRMTPVSPSFRKYRTEIRGVSEGNKKAEVIGRFLRNYYQEKDGYYQLNEKAQQASQAQEFSLFDKKEDRVEAERVYSLGESQKRQGENRLFERLENQVSGGSVGQKEGITPRETTAVIPVGPRFRFQAPSFVKDFASNGQIFARRLISRFPLASATVFSSAVGALAGGGATGSAQGAVFGGALGAVLPSALKTGLPGLFGGVGGTTALGQGLGLAGKGLGGARLAAGLAGGPAGAALTAASLLADEKAKKLIKWIVIGIGVAIFVILVLIPMGLLKTTSLFGPGGVGAPGGSSAPGGVASLQISKTGVTETQKGGDVLYKIQVTYKGEGSANIRVTDNIPSGYPDSSIKAIFNSFGSDTIGSISCNSDVIGNYLDSGRLAVWDLTSVPKDTTKTLCLKVKAPDADTYLSNSASAEIVSVNRDSGSANGVRLALSGPNQVPDTDTTITYSIEASYLNPGTATIQIYNKLPANLAFQSTDSTGGCSTSLAGQYDNSTNTVTWSQVDLKQNEKVTACLTVKPTAEADKTTVENAVKAKIVKIDSPVIAGGDEVPNDNTCSGVYAPPNTYSIDKNPLHKNFGDPSCTLAQLADRDKLYTVLQQQDPTEAAFWFWMAECEASYIANAYTGDSPANGAWGLYQMGASVNGPGNSGPGKDGKVYDRGDVAWPKQVSNAVNHKNLRESQGKRFHSGQSYWQCAYPDFCSGINPPASCNSPNRPR